MEINTTRPKILIIDDDEVVARVLQPTLSENGFSPIFAMDGKEGLERIKADKPAVIILDRSMPVMDGHEVLRKIKDDNTINKIPIMMLTADKDTEDIKKCIALGANDYVVKPFTPNNIISRLRRLIKLAEQT